jgi:hypothetical protein
MRKIGRFVFALTLFCVSVPAFAETEGPGIAEVKELQAAQKSVADATKAWEDAKAKKPSSPNEIAQTKMQLDIQKLRLAAAQEKVRPVLSELAASVPAKDTPVSKEKCYMARPLFGDLAPLGLENWSVGITLATSVVRYDFSSKKAALATGAGAGIAIRYYGRSYLGTRDETKVAGFTDETIESIKKRYGKRYVNDETDEVYLPLSSVKPECRASTSDFGQERKDKLAASIFSLTPIVYYSKQTTENDLNLQPAIMLGFLDDIISIGTGFNLTGQEKGKMFLLMSLGYGFKF